MPDMYDPFHQGLLWLLFFAVGFGLSDLRIRWAQRQKRHKRRMARAG